MPTNDPFRYEGKHVLVVGGATGMGAAAAQTARDLGATVTILDHVEVDDPGVVSLRVDLREPDDVDAALSKVDGPVDALVSAAGVADGTPGLMKVNFIGHRHIIDALLADGRIGRGGAICMISSVAGLSWETQIPTLAEFLATDGYAAAVDWVLAHDGTDSYVFSKQAINCYVARQSYPLLAKGIRINAVCPGPTDTPLARANADLWLGFGADYREATGTEPLTPEQIARDDHVPQQRRGLRRQRGQPADRQRLHPLVAQRLLRARPDARPAPAGQGLTRVATTTPSAEFEQATDYSFKEEDIERAKALAGRYSAWPSQEHLTVCNYDSMRNFARSYGDDNPLYGDRDHGRTTRWGAQIAAPMIPIAMNLPLLEDPEADLPRRPSFRGIHVFVSGSRWDWFRPLYEGDEVYSFGGIESVVEKKSEFAERSLLMTYAFIKVNQRAEAVAISRTLAIHTERKTAREKGKYSAIEPATYSEEQLAELEAIYAAERCRGAEPRWWEDVEVGEQLTPMAKGPLTQTDMIVFHAGGYGFVPYELCANRLAHKNRARIAPFYVKNEHGIPDVAQRVHWDSAWAQAIGNPMAYDYGVMRDCHLSHFVTDWMGDDGWLVQQASEIRKFNYIGDSHVITGEVVGKRMEAGRGFVEIEMRGTNQRGEVTCPGTATVALPSREHGPVVLPEPPADLQRQAVQRMERHRQLLRT